MKTIKELTSGLVILLTLVLVFSYGLSIRGQEEAGNATDYVVEELEISGNAEIPDERILENLGLQEGDSVSRSQLEENVNKVRDMGVFGSVDSEIEVADNRLNIKLNLKEYPVLKEFKFEGVNLINTGKLEKDLNKAGVKKGQVLNKNKLNEGLKKISKTYEENGYPLVSIGEVKIEEALSIEVIEGKLASVRIDGLDTIPREVALGMIEGETGKPVKLRDLQKSYQNLQNSIYLTSVELIPARGYSKSDIILRWKVTERKLIDKPAEASKVALAGNTVFSSDELRGLLDPDLPDPVTNYSLLKELSPIYEKYIDRGYDFVDFSVDGVESGAINVDILEGKIANIEIKGNTKTAKKVITNKILFERGDIFRSDLLQDSRRRLLNLGYFSKVEPKSVEVSEGIKLMFTVEEKTRLNSVNGGLTWSNNGLAGRLQLSTKNIFGQGQDLSLNLNRKFSLDAKFGGSIDWKNVYYPSGFNFTKLSLYRNVGSNQGLKASFGYPLSGNLSLNVGYKADWILGEDADSSLTHILSADLIYDDRNNPMFPTAGTRRSLKIEKAGDFAPGLSFTQITFEGSYFQGLPTLDFLGDKKQTFGFNLQLGLGIDTPENYQTEFGGKNSIRGLGPGIASSYGFVNNEYRLQLVPGGLYIASFVDSGVDFDSESNYDFKTSAGIEINLQMFGHLRIGAAWNLSGDFSYVPSLYFGMGPIF